MLLSPFWNYILRGNSVGVPFGIISDIVHFLHQESHIHSLMNVLRYCNLDESLQGEESLVCQSALDRLHRTRELDYMSNIVLRMFENTEVWIFSSSLSGL